MNSHVLIPHLFRTEYSKMVAVLCKAYGMSMIELVEDMVSDTFLKATETWGMKGVPHNPTAWLYRVASNRIKDHFKRQQIFNEKVAFHIAEQHDVGFSLEFSEENINDSMLRMMFVVCQKSLSQESQIALALRILCGFSIDEIANALLSNKANINKRLTRAKKELRESDFGIVPVVCPSELKERTGSVLSILYLLFNEGYFSTVSNEKIRKDLCFEAMRLLHIVINSKSTHLSEAHAMMALFCFQASRFDARTNTLGEQILYNQQNTKKWDNELIERGEYYLCISADGGDGSSKYHIEAIIAFWHTRKSPDQKEKWVNILHGYNRLLQIQYSPIAALNRTYALAMVRGKEAGLKEALKIKLEQNPLYHSLLAELYCGLDTTKQIAHLEMAIKWAKSENDQFLLEKKRKAALGDLNRKSQ